MKQASGAKASVGDRPHFLYGAHQRPHNGRIDVVPRQSSRWERRRVRVRVRAVRPGGTHAPSLASQRELAVRGTRVGVKSTSCSQFLHRSFVSSCPPPPPKYPSVFLFFSEHTRPHSRGTCLVSTRVMDVRWFEEHHPEQGNFTHESDRDAIRAVLAKQVRGWGGACILIGQGVRAEITEENEMSALCFPRRTSKQRSSRPPSHLT